MKNGKAWNIDRPKFWSETLQKGPRLKNLDVDGRIILKLVLSNKKGSVNWIFWLKVARAVVNQNN